MLNIKNKKQKGTFLLMTVLIMSILLAIGLGLSALLLPGIEIIKGMGDSVVAFYAADSGVEEALKRLYIDRENLPFEIRLIKIGEASYFVSAFPAVRAEEAGFEDCPQPPNKSYCIKSVGIYKGTRRAIEVSY